MKKLYRSSKNRIIAGVCGGLAEYLELDPSILRLIFIVLSILGALPFFGVVYLAIMFIVPLESQPDRGATVAHTPSEPPYARQRSAPRAQDIVVEVHETAADANDNSSVLGK